MDTRNRRCARSQARGAVRPTVIIVVAVFALLAVAAWFLIIQPHEEIVMQDAGGHPSTPVSTGKVAAPPPANVEAMDLNQLLAEARKAMNEQRLLAPAGNNAFEFYLKALEKQPGNPVATDALRETFPFAASAAEQEINARDFNEAERQIALLAKADPANYTLTILRSKLDAQRKLLDREQQQLLDQQKQQQLAAEKAAAEKAAADKAAETKVASEPKTGLAQQPTTSPDTAGQPPAEAGNAATAETSVAENSPAVRTESAAPRYPMQARRRRQEGWVLVSYTVRTDGSVGDVNVVDAKPRHVFERAATDAVERWRFKPAMHNGQPVSSSLQQKILFTLGGQ